MMKPKPISIVHSTSDPAWNDSMVSSVGAFLFVVAQAACMMDQGKRFWVTVPRMGRFFPAGLSQEAVYLSFALAGSRQRVGLRWAVLFPSTPAAADEAPNKPLPSPIRLASHLFEPELLSDFDHTSLPALTIPPLLVGIPSGRVGPPRPQASCPASATGFRDSSSRC